MGFRKVEDVGKVDTSRCRVEVGSTPAAAVRIPPPKTEQWGGCGSRGRTVSAIGELLTRFDDL